MAVVTDLVEQELKASLQLDQSPPPRRSCDCDVHHRFDASIPFVGSALEWFDFSVFGSVVSECEPLAVVVADA